MAKMDLPPWLTKRYGPLPGWGWIVAGILGILLGLYLRRAMAVRRSAASGDSVEAGPWSDLGGAATREGIGIVGSDTTPEPPASDIATPDPSPPPFPDIIRIEVPKVITVPSPTEDKPKTGVPMPGSDYVKDNVGKHWVVTWATRSRFGPLSGSQQSKARGVFGAPKTRMSQTPRTYQETVKAHWRKRGWDYSGNDPIYLDVRIPGGINSSESWSGQGVVGGIPA